MTEGSATRRGVWPRNLALILTALALLRLFWFATHDPILGYANQFDMARIAACLDFWPADSASPTEATPAAPLRWYRRTQVAQARCFPSSEVVLAGLLLAIVDPGQSGKRLDLRMVGVGKALALAAFVLLFTWLLRRDGWALLLHGAIVLLVLADPANLLYLNSLYAEFSALIGAYVALASLGITAYRRQVTWLLSCTFALGLVVLLTSKMQHLLLPWLILVMAAMALRTVPNVRRFLLPALALAAASTWQVSASIKADPAIHHANVYNTAFVTVLPAAADAGRVIGDWGLRPQCIRLVGTSWFNRRGHDLEHACPESLSVSRSDMVATFVREPAALLRILFRSLFQSGGWMLGFVGHVEGEHYAHVLRGRGLQYLSYAGIPMVVPYAAYLSVLLFPFAYVAGGSYLRHRRRAASPGADACLLLLAVHCVCIAATWGCRCSATAIAIWQSTCTSRWPW